MTWRDRMTGFDTETTGTDPETARIVTAAVVEAGRVPLSWMLRQSEPIPAEATAVHGITTEQANTDGTDHEQALDQIRDALQTAWRQGRAVVAYNAIYDLTVLDRELTRHGLGHLNVSGLVVDPLLMLRAIPATRKGSARLADVCDFLGVKLGDDAHGAEADALAACRLAWKLSTLPDVRGVKFIDMSDAELMDWQRDAYATQAGWLNARRLAEGREPVPTGRTWPLNTVLEQVTP